MSKQIQAVQKYIKDTFIVQGRNVEIETVNDKLCVVDDDTDQVLLVLEGRTMYEMRGSFLSWCRTTPNEDCSIVVYPF